MNEKFYTTGTENKNHDGLLISIEGTTIRNGTHLDITEGLYSIEINVEGTGHRGDIIVYKPKNTFGQYRLAAVNWGAIGSQEPKVARDFANGLNYAADAADYINELESKNA